MRPLDFPNVIQIETVSTCNARCGFCPYPETSRTQPQGAMNDELFASIVEQLSKEDVHLIQPFLNNDPLTDNKIVARLAVIIGANPRARVMITTNGVRLRETTIQELVELNLDTIHVSSNGLTADVYRSTMGIDGYTVLHNVNRLWDEIRRRGARTKLVVTAILTATNRREIQHMREYWRSRGVTFYLNALNDRAGNLPTERFVRLLPFNRGAARTQMYRADMSGCPSLYSFMGIHWNGDVIRCCNDWRRARIMGNAREQTLRDIWHGERYREMREMSDRGRLNEVELCGDCGDNRFSIDLGAMRDFLERQAASGNSDAGGDLRVLAMIERFQQGEPDLLKLGLVR